MTQEEKQLLLKDLCARLPYGVKILYTGWDNDRGFEYQVVEKLVGVDDHFIYTLWGREKNKHSIKFADFKPYLRPMSSMTNEEWCEYCDSCAEDEKEVIITHKWYRIVPTTHKEHFFNIHHFDYRSLIEKGLALEAPKDMYKTEWL